MRFIILICLWVCLSPVSAEPVSTQYLFGQDSETNSIFNGDALSQVDSDSGVIPVKLDTPVKAAPWSSVGRLDTGGGGFCTGTLIAPDLVVTAAHCFFNPHDGSRIDTSRVKFLSGWRNGVALAQSPAKRIEIDDKFVFSDGNWMDRIQYDIAVVQLQSEIAKSDVQPFSIANRPTVGEDVTMVSYAINHTEVATKLEPCDVLARSGERVIIDCVVLEGASGGPVFVMENGQYKIGAIITSSVETDLGYSTAAVGLSVRLDALRNKIASTPADRENVFSSGSGSIDEQLGRTGGGASDLFITPPKN